MNKTAVLFGSTTGNTENVAKTIAAKLNADLYNVADSPLDKLSDYQNLILGTSTWGLGDLQDDWYSFLPQFAKSDLSNKTIALFGVGDSSSYPDTYVDGMGIIYAEIMDKGCKIIGSTKTDGYSHSESKSVRDGMFVGLALDEDNESNKTADRIDNWVNDIKGKL